MFAEDLSVFFGDFAIQMTVGGATAAVLLDAPTMDVLGGKAQSVEYAATVPVVSFPTLARGDSVTLTGSGSQSALSGAYTVRESPDHMGDGVLMHVKLARV